MRRAIWKRRLALLMALVLVWNVLGDYPVRVQAADSIPGEQAGFNVHSFEVNLVEGDTKTPITDESMIYSGANVEVTFNWTLDNSVRLPVGEPWEDQVFTIDTTAAEFAYSGLNIPGMTAGTATSPLPLRVSGQVNAVGSYYMQDGIIYIIIEDQEFFQNEANRYGGVLFNGEVEKSDDNTEDGKPKEIQFGTHSSTPIYYLTDTESSAQVSKATSGNVVAKDGKHYQTFTVTVKANNGTVTEIDLADSVTPAGMLTNASDVKITSSTVEDVPAGDFASLDEALAAIKAATFYMDETLTLQYTMEVDASVYEQNAGQYKNVITGTYQSNRDDSPKEVYTEASVYVNKPSISKASKDYQVRDGKGYVIWTITIYLGDYYTGSGSDLADYLSSITDMPGTGLVDAGGNLTLNPADFVQDTSDPKVFTYTYETEVEQSLVDSTADETVKNKVKMTMQDGNVYESWEASYTIPGDGPYVEKTIQNMERDEDGLHVTWNIEISGIPKEGITELSLDEDARHWNNNPGNQALLYEIYIDGVLAADENGIIATDKIQKIENWSGVQYGTIVFVDEYVNSVAAADGVIHVQVKTLITEDTIGKEYGNGAKASYKDKTTGSKTTMPESRATFQDTTNLMSKEATVVNGKDAIDYKIKVILPALDIQDTGKHFVIDDVLPVGMKISDAGATVILTDQWGNKRSDITHVMTSSEVSVEGSQEKATKLSFDIEAQESWVSLIKGYDGGSGDGYYLVVQYRAELKDRAAFLKDGVEKNFTNSASGSYGGNSIGADSTTTKLIPTQIMDKSAEYTQTSAPFIKYTVEVNTEAVTLLDGTAMLQAVDTIGSALEFVDSDYFDDEMDKQTYRVQVIDVATGTELTCNTHYTYTISSNNQTLRFELPDGKHLRLIYWAYAVPGVRLTPENSTNSFGLSGMTSDALSDEYSFDLVAYTPGGWAGSEMGSIVIYKFWTDQGEQVALEGSVFRLIKVKYDEDTQTLVPDGEDGSEVLYESIAITDENRVGEDGSGMFRIKNLPVNQIMALYEIDADEGFALNKEPYYFVLEGSTAVTIPDGLGVDKYFSGDTLDYENEKAATLILEKTVEGAAAQADIEGVITFTIKDAEGNLVGTYQPGDEGFTYANGKWTLTLNNLAAGSYTVEETVCDAAGHEAVRVVYTIDAGEWSSDEEDAKDTEAVVTLVEEETTTLTFKNVYEGFTVPVSKVILGGTTPLAGAKLRITGTRLDATVIEPIEWTTTDAPYQVELYAGSYVLEEVTVPAGYKKAADIAFTVSVDGTIIVGVNSVDTVEMADEPISIKLSKVDATDHTMKLAGATIGLYHAADIGNDGEPLAGADAIATWDTTVEAYDFGSFLELGKDYILVELSAPSGYELADNIAISVSEEGEVTVTTNGITVNDGVILMEDAPMVVQEQKGSLKVTKTFTEADDRLTWAEIAPTISFEIYDENDEEVTGSPIAGTDLQLKGGVYESEALELPIGTYRVKEIHTAITDYEVTTTYTITVGVTAGGSGSTTEAGNVEVEADTTTVVAYENTYSYTGTYPVPVSKVILGGNTPLAGAQLTITGTKASGDAITPISWTSGGAAYEAQLYPGSYTLTETQAPTGYEVADPIDFTVEEDGTIKVAGSTVTGIVMEDAPMPAQVQVGTLILTKTVAGTMNRAQLEGVLKFMVENADANTEAFRETYTLGEGNFRWDEASSRYVLTITNLPVGSYKVTEILGNSTPSNMSCTVTYTVNAGLPQNGTATGAVTIGQNREIAIEYTNTYDYLTGKLQITKTFIEDSDTLRWDDVKDKIRFRIYDGSGTEIQESPIEGAALLTSGSVHASLELNLPIDTYKVVEELDTVTGYQVVTSYSITVDGADNGSGNSVTADNIGLEDGKTVVVAYTNTYTKEAVQPELGILKLNKTVNGPMDRTALEGKLKFTIESVPGAATAFSRTYILGEGDFGWNAGLGKYVLTITDMPVGSYIVKEILGNTTPDHMTCEVSYTVDTTPAQNGTGTDTGNITIGKDEEITVAYTNTYAEEEVVPGTGKLIITKTLKGNVERSLAENAITFTVTNHDTGEVVTYKLSDFTYDQATGIYTLELTYTEGGYTVEETATDVDGYKLTKVTYTVNGSTQTGKKAVIQVPEDDSVTVAFVDTYSKKNAKAPDDEDDDEDDEDEDETPDEVPPTLQTTSLTQTGDDTPLMLWMIMFACGLVGLLTGCGVLMRNRKRG